MIEAPWATALAGLAALYWAATALRLGRGMARIDLLRDHRPVEAGDAPAVSVCVAARNEAGKVEAGLRSMVGLAYPSLEVVAVDDRSDDATGEILDRLSEDHPALRVLHVDELPDGWLGKNHALQRAADAARGELLLFTDADVLLAPDALARAVGCLRERGLDHLAVSPELEMPGPLLQAFAATFQVTFAQFAAPWKAREPGSRCHVGVGAFNLVRADAYRAAGGHEAIRMRPDDDMRLARSLKRSGARPDVLFGTGRVRVSWYDSLRAAVRGLGRAAWAGLDDSYLRAAGGLLVLLGLHVWPWIGAAAAEGAARWLNLAAAAVSAGVFVGATGVSRARAWHAVLLPLTGLLLAWVLVRSVALTLIRGGIEWRGTFYPLDRLRTGRHGG